MIMLWLNKYAIEESGTQFKYGMNNLWAYLSTYFNRLNCRYICGSTILFCKPDSNSCFLNVFNISFYIVLCQSHLLQTAHYFIVENGNMYLFSFLF